MVGRGGIHVALEAHLHVEVTDCLCGHFPILLLEHPPPHTAEKVFRLLVVIVLLLEPILSGHLRHHDSRLLLREALKLQFSQQLLVVYVRGLLILLRLPLRLLHCTPLRCGELLLWCHRPRVFLSRHPRLVVSLALLLAQLCELLRRELCRWGCRWRWWRYRGRGCGTDRRRNCGWCRGRLRGGLGCYNKRRGGRCSGAQCRITGYTDLLEVVNSHR
mmetsp:Transcript_33490/g.71189  ORF Transcript_33490/g.71189 Transcript_33490/m.71189 type:complete len:217 (-) Transcript_33490:63-713(-)